MKKQMFVALTFISLILLVAPKVYPHSGGTDDLGCHRDNSAWLITYHCHGSAAYKIPTAAVKGLWGLAFSEEEPERKRSSSARRAFHSRNPCPSTGKTSGPCPGYHVDHIDPLACGGADSPSNMQWLTAFENLSKGSRGCRY